MAKSSWTTRLQTLAIELSLDSEVAVYLFGSALRSESPSDLDLLLVYPGHQKERAWSARDLIRNAVSQRLGLSCDFCIFSSSEAAENSFIREEEATQVWPFTEVMGPGNGLCPALAPHLALFRTAEEGS